MGRPRRSRHGRKKTARTAFAALRRSRTILRPRIFGSHERDRGLPALDRRAVLGAALAGGAGVAAARMPGWRRVVEVDPPQLTADAVAKRSGLDWVSPLGDEATRVAHLLRRTTFGYTPAELEAAVADGYQRTVDPAMLRYLDLAQSSGRNPNFAAAAIAQLRTVPRPDDAHAVFLDATLGPQTLRLLNEAHDDRRRWTVVLCCSEFQLK